MRRHGRKVVGIVIHVVTVARLGRPAVASPVMGDDAIAVLEEEQHLGVPVVGRQRPAVAEHDGLALAPVLVKDLNVVLGRDGGHRTLLVEIRSRHNGPPALRRELYERRKPRWSWSSGPRASRSLMIMSEPEARGPEDQRRSKSM